MHPIIAKIFKFICYSNPLSALAENRILGYLFPAVVGLYYLTLDVWGNDWPMIRSHKELHQNIYILLVCATLFFIFLKLLRAFYLDLTKTTKADVRVGLIMLASRVVSAKLERFKGCAEDIDATTNTFKKITKPQEQIQVIISEMITYLYNTFEIDDDEVCITITHFDTVSNRWHFMNDTHRGWNHTKAGRLFTERSMAALAMSRGEPVFHPDKMAASKKGEYFPSDKDKRDKKGSAFCHPVVVKVNGTEFKFVISLITYGKMLCNTHNPEQVKAIKLTLMDICRRIELELTLWSIKFSQSSASPSTTSRIAGGRP